MPIHIAPTDVLRLKQRREFLRVAGAGHKWVAPGLILQARTHMPGEAFKVKENDEGKDGNDANGFRLGFTVSRKVAARWIATGPGDVSGRLRKGSCPGMLGTAMILS